MVIEIITLVVLALSAVINVLTLFSIKKKENGSELSRELKFAVDDSIRREQEVFSTVVRSANLSIIEANDRYNKSITENFNSLTETVRRNLAEIRGETNAQLDKMRQTVDEKLAENLEKRFEVISSRMDSVLKGLGEMKALSESVGSLNNVLANVKARGTWGEVSLKALLEQILTEKQFRQSVPVKRGSLERVDFAVVLPGRDGEEVLLPIDSKFPTEDYQRIVDASREGDREAVEFYGHELEKRILSEGRSIRDKYVLPPKTTDFAIMYLPTEGLYAEVIRRGAVVEKLQNECKIVVAGPTTLSALLNSLQLGFQTLAIEKSSLEVKKHLAQFKREFEMFGREIATSQRQIKTVSDTIDKVVGRTNKITQKLGKIEIGEADTSGEGASLPFSEE